MVNSRLNQSNVFIKAFLHQLMSQSAVQKPSLKTPNSKQCRCRSTVARKNSLERPKPRKKPREEPGFWLCRVEIITEHGQDVQMFINDQHGQIIIITVVVEGAGVNVSWLFIADH